MGPCKAADYTDMDRMNVYIMERLNMEAINAVQLKNPNYTYRR